MKKITVLLFSFILFCEFLTAQNSSLLYAAKTQNYKLFEELVKNGASLDETTESGMNVQLSLAYFSSSDFKKACKLLNKQGFDFDKPNDDGVTLLYVLCYSCAYEKVETLLNYNVDVNKKNPVSDLIPIDATQFSTFKFYSEQIIPEEAYDRAEKTRKVLLKHGSQEFQYCQLTFSKIGNFIICVYILLTNFYPFLTPNMINSAEMYDLTPIKDQPQATVLKDSLIELFNSINIKNEIKSYTNQNDIVKELVNAAVSKDAYMLIANTGNNPVAPYQWVCVNGGIHEGLLPDEYLDVANPDKNFEFVDYQVKDISHLITIKYEFEELE